MDKHFFTFHDTRNTRVNLAGLRAYREASQCRIRLEYADGTIFHLEYMNKEYLQPDFDALEQWLGTSEWVIGPMTGH